MTTAQAHETKSDPYAAPAKGALLQIGFLSPDGVTWKVVGESVTEHNTVDKIGRLFAAAKLPELAFSFS